MKPRLTKQDLEYCKYPWEDFWFKVAVAVVIPVVLCIYFLTKISLQFLLVALLVLSVTLWLAHAFAKAYLMGNAVRISNNNFPEVARLVEEVKFILDYPGEVPVFVVDNPEFNASFSKFLKIQFIVLRVDLVEELLEQREVIQLKWVIARYIGTLKAKQVRFDILKVLLSTIERIKLFNLFILPYERAIQFTGDNIGLAACGSLPEVMKAFDKYLFGSQLAKHLALAGILEQSKENRKDFMAYLFWALSPQPPIIDRYLNLLAFSKKYFPQQFKSYTERLGPTAFNEISEILPTTYENKHVIRFIRVPPVRRQDSVKQKIKINKRR